MSSNTGAFTGKHLTVRYDRGRCLHAAGCVEGAPEVFVPGRKPWVAPDEMDAAKLIAVIDSCPTGALSVESNDGGSLLPVAELNSVVVEADGPLIVRGDLKLTTMDGAEILSDTRLALCRCGVSKNKPYCDNSHVEAGFRDPGALGSTAGSDGETDASGMKIAPAPDGPLLVNGPCTISGGGVSVTTVKTALCRCGLSENKPYCDGAHSAGGFQAD